MALDDKLKLDKGDIELLKKIVEQGKIYLTYAKKNKLYESVEKLKNAGFVEPKVSISLFGMEFKIHYLPNETAAQYLKTLE